MLTKQTDKSIFRRMLIVYGLIMALAVVLIEMTVTVAVRESTIEKLISRLTVETRLISDSLPSGRHASLDEFSTHVKSLTGSRVTIISSRGEVLGDSHGDSRSMDNHGHRQEIQQAALNGTGMAIRFSETLKYDFLYVAVQTELKGTGPLYVRQAIPLREVDEAVNMLRIKLLSVVLAIVAASGLFSVGQIMRLRRLTGQIRDFSIAIASGDTDKRLFFPRDDEFSDIAGSLNTLSEELRLRTSCQEAEQHRLNMILRNIPDALFIIDIGGTIMQSSGAARKLFGETALKGRPFIEVVRSTEFIELMETVTKEERTASAEIRLDTPIEQHCVVQVSPLFFRERELSGYVAIFHDVTQLKKMEQTRKDFVANVSHEIRTPITAIQGFAETLLEGALDDREHALPFLKSIRSNSERINNLVEDLLTVSKLELGAIKAEKRSIDLRDVAEQVVATLRDKAAEKNLAFTTAIPQNLAVIEADRDRLVQILTNLADNAIRFTDTGSIILGIELENGRHVLTVQDTGIGIAQKHLPRLGERFYRVDPDRSRSRGGTGLGLAIVKHLVKVHQWDMDIESRPGKGTKIKIFIS